MEQSAVSTVRLLRNLGLVTGTRSARASSTACDHVAMPLDQAVYHMRLGISDAPAGQAAVSSVSWTAAEDPGAVLAAGRRRYRRRNPAGAQPTGAPC